MKRDHLLWGVIILILGSVIYFGLERYASILKKEDLKEAQRIEKIKNIKIKRKAYMDKIKTISLFGIHFQDDVRKLAFYSSQEVTDRYGLYVGDQSDADIPILKRYSIQIIPPNKNENFMSCFEFFTSYKSAHDYLSSNNTTRTRIINHNKVFPIKAVMKIPIILTLCGLPGL